MSGQRRDTRTEGARVLREIWKRKEKDGWVVVVVKTF